MRDDGWDRSARAWIVEMADGGDYGRRFVLDAPMLARIAGRGFATALDIGCGEGRFCRMLQTYGMTTTGIDPTATLIEVARERDPLGDYRIATAEALDVAPGSFDLAVCYLSLIDIPDLAAASSPSSSRSCPRRWWPRTSSSRRLRCRPRSFRTYRASCNGTGRSRKSRGNTRIIRGLSTPTTTEPSSRGELKDLP